MSVLSQTCPPDEIVVSDDMSTDGTLSVIARVFDGWKADHPDSPIRMIVLRPDVRRGVTANFERAMGACHGDLIALCDQDDMWRAERLHRIVATFDRRKTLLLLHGDARICDEDGRPSGATLFETLKVTAWERAAVARGDGYTALLRRNLVTGATTVIRRELLGLSTPFPADWVHDEWLGIIAAASGEIDLILEPLVDYRQHSTNQIGARKLDLKEKVGRLTASRYERNDRLVRRAMALVDRLSSGSVDGVLADRVVRAEAKLAHEMFRQGLSATRGKRIIPIVQRVMRGDYEHFSRGSIDAFRDFLQAP